jgi:nucleotide-binding universal stress UspA family protein
MRPGLFERILVPVDFFGPSREVLALLKHIPSAGHIFLLHVVDKGESAEEIQAAVKAANEKLAIIKNDLAADGIAAEGLVHVGDPPDEINATAERNDITLILMTPRGEGWTRELRSFVIGSTTNAVVRRADRPVLVAAGQKTD